MRGQNTIGEVRSTFKYLQTALPDVLDFAA